MCGCGFATYETAVELVLRIGENAIRKGFRGVGVSQTCSNHHLCKPAGAQPIGEDHSGFFYEDVLRIFEDVLKVFEDVVRIVELVDCGRRSFARRMRSYAISPATSGET